MKIAIIYDMLYPYSIGGAEYRNFTLGKSLVLKGHEIHLFGLCHWSGSKTKKIAKNFYMHGLSKSKKKYNFTGKRKILDPIIYSIKLFFELFKHDFDIIDVSSFPYFPALAVIFYSLFKKTKIVVTWHEVWLDYWDKYLGLFGFIGQFIEKILALCSKNNIAVSNQTNSNLKKITKNKIQLIYNWIDFENIKKAEPLKQKYDVISIGRHLKHKNFDMLIKLIPLLKKKRKNIKVLIVGRGPETHVLLSYRKALKLENNLDILNFTNDHDQIYSYLKSSKLFVLLSELEGFSIISMEAMACGLPVITLNTKKNALQDLIKNDETGYVLDKDELIIANKIEYLLKHESKINQMSKKAKEFSKEFDIKSKTNQIEEYYKKLK
jgi:L-malate glycosyltransferase